jgi:hypothetical protein
MKKPEPSNLLMDLRTIRDCPPADWEPENMKQLRALMEKSPTKMMAQMFSLERDFEQRMLHWEQAQQEEKMEQKISPCQAPDVGSEEAIALVTKLLKEYGK